MPINNLRYCLTVLFLFLSCSTLPEDIPGCTNPSSCNFNTDAKEDDGSCAYLDCLNNCGGDAYIDPCGYCDSDPENDCAVECGAITEQLSIGEEEF